MDLWILPGDKSYPSFSPFSIKSMMMFAHADIDVNIKEVSNPQKSPTGKLPLLVVGDIQITDSEAIHHYLRDHHGADFDMGLDQTERAAALGFQRLIEEHLYFLLVYRRWSNDTNFEPLRQLFRTELPLPLRGFVPQIIRRQVLNGLKGQGVARMDDTVRLARLRADLGALADQLGDKPYMMGENITSVDFAMIGTLSLLYSLPAQGDFEEISREFDNLLAYTERNKAHFFPRLMAMLGKN